jgi:hypothetical protein
MPRAKKQVAAAVCTCKEPKTLAMFFGLLLALMHLGWAILVASGYAQMLYDWILSLHMLSIPITVLPFNLVMAVELIIVTFIIGYVMGWIIALVWNKVGKCKCTC